MKLAGALFVGVDTASAHKSFTYAALDRGLNVVALGEAELDEIAAYLDSAEALTAAINAPSHLNQGLVRLAAGGNGSVTHQLRGVDVRVAEHELRQRGIPVSGTGARESSCPAWIRVGLTLYRRMTDLGFEAYPTDECPRQWIETHPHAAFCALLGRTPLSKPSLEGRLQRQLVLHEQGVRIRDPMTFFEEITRHKLLKGVLPSEIVYFPEQLDALVAAYTAWLSSEKPSELTRLGTAPEGYIHLPVSQLKESYQA